MAVVVDDDAEVDAPSLTVALNWVSPLATADCCADFEFAASICSCNAALVARVTEVTSTPP